MPSNRGNDHDRRRPGRSRDAVFLQAILDGARNVSLIVTDANGADPRVLEFSRGAEAMFGYTRDEMIGRPVSVLHLPEDVARLPEAFRLMREGKESFSGMTTLVRKDGRRFPALFSSYPLFDEGGAMTAALAVSVDLSEQVAIENRLRESEKRFRSIVHGSPMGIYLYELAADGRLVLIDANPAADKWTRTDNQVLIGKTIEEAFPKLAATEIPDVYRRVAREGGRWQTLGLHYEDERIRGTYDVHCFQTSPGRMAVMFTDVTDRKRAEDERDRLFNLSIDMMCVAGMDGTFRQVNPAWTGSLGWSADELLAAPWMDLVHPEDHAATVAAWEKLRLGRPIDAFENRYRCKDGRYRWLSWNAMPLEAEGLILAVARDITAHRDMEEQLRHAQKMEAIGQLAGGVAHDFNNLLTGILGNAELLQDDGTLSGTQRACASDIVEAGRRAADLTRELLAFSRKTPLEHRTVDLHEVIAQVEKLLTHSIDRNIRIEQALKAAPALVTGDRAMIHNTIVNLAINARDAMPEGGRLTLATENVVIGEGGIEHQREALTPGAYVQISVTDTGVGIAESERSRIFEPFYTTKPVGQGTGLGLASVYGCVRNHGGMIRVASAIGAGSTFTVLLPAATIDERDPSEFDPPEVQRGSGHVLVVDDEELVRTVAAAALERLGYTVTACANGGEALRLFESMHGRLAAVLLDLVMPNMNGEQVLAQMLAIDDRVPIILCSGYARDHEVDSMTRSRAAALLSKPFRLDELSRTLHACINGAR